MENRNMSQLNIGSTPFPELNLHTLQGYAKCWAGMFPAIQRITLYRSKKSVTSSRYTIFVQISHQFNRELIKAFYQATSPAESEKISAAIYAEYDQETIRYLNWSFGNESATHVLDELESCYTRRQADLAFRDEWMWITDSIEDPPPSEWVLDEPQAILYEAPDVAMDEPHVILAPETFAESIREEIVGGIEISDGNAFVLQGDYWQVCYNGIRKAVKNIECVRYIAHLLEKPGQAFYAGELRALVKGRPVSQKGNQASDEGPASFDDKIEKSDLFEENSDYNIVSEMAFEELSDEDEEALKKTVQDSWQKLHDAKEYESDESIEEAEENFQKVCRYLLNEYGWQVQYSPEGPKVKKHKKLINEMEKERQAVGRQISNGIARIEKHLPALSEYLKRHIQKGRECIYHPTSNAPEWRVTWNS